MKPTFVPGLITVALCARNAEDTIADSISSILKQNYDLFQLFVIDDASQDETFKVACQGLKDSRVKVIRLSRQIGTDAGKNFVLRNFAEGEFFAYQDADDISYPKRFSNQFKFLRANPDVVACGTGTDEFFTEEDKFLVQHMDIPSKYDIVKKADGYFHRMNIYPERIGPDPEFYSHVIAANGSLLFRTPIFVELGGNDGRSLVAAGDTELLLRLSKLYTIANIPEILYSRRFHGASVTASSKYGRDSVNRKLYCEKMNVLHEKLQYMLRAGEVEKFRQACIEDMYYPKTEIVEEYSYDS